jgi:ADP-ribosylglycohydrolase
MSKRLREPEERREHARGCLLGQLAGDALGSLVEFQSAEQIREIYPDGVRLLVAGGSWNTIAGQPTDDSEMALALARTLLEHGTYVQDAARDAYRAWLDSVPFDVGMTTFNGLKNLPDHGSQANGALMRISPLGIFGASRPSDELAEWARRDAYITHPNRVCVDVNVLFVLAIAHAVAMPVTADELYGLIDSWAAEIPVRPEVRDVIRAARQTAPHDYLTHQGWVLIAFQNALWQLLHASSLEEGVVDTVMRGGDTDTNAAICGALLGAVHGHAAIPAQWEAAILACRPEKGRPNVLRPRPPIYWPVDALDLAENLVEDEAAVG